MENQLQIFLNGNNITNTHTIVIHSRINNCGTLFNTNKEQTTLSPFDKRIDCIQLSITNKRWVGHTKMSSYIVELIKNNGDN